MVTIPSLDATPESLGLSQRIIDSLLETFSRYPKVERVIIYGSRARGDYRPGSDIDLAVIAPKMRFDEFSQLWNEIDDLPIAFNIDLLHLDTLKNQALKSAIKAARRSTKIAPLTKRGKKEASLGEGRFGGMNASASKLIATATT